MHCSVICIEVNFMNFFDIQLTGLNNAIKLEETPNEQQFSCVNEVVLKVYASGDFLISAEHLCCAYLVSPATAGQLAKVQKLTSGCTPGTRSYIGNLDGMGNYS